MGLISRLHWWTVEYGLIGTLDKPKIYGAGLLSSIGESVSCLEPNVEKRWYSVDAANQAFDITTKQPQLFVCRDFQHLSDVLEEFASRMAYRVGGLEGLNKAVECKRPATAQYSSGLQVTGVFTEVLTDDSKQPIYLRTSGPSALAFDHKQLDGHGKEYHAEGFGSPIGTWRVTDIREGKDAKLEFHTGVTVSGHVERILQRDGQLILITFSNCTAKLGDRVLFDPSWGTYDMAVGDSITSVFNGAADKDAYLEVALVPKERTIKAPSDEKRRKLENLYAQVREIRSRKVGYERLGEIWETQQAEHADDWLLSMEIFEILDDAAEQNDLKQRIVAFLNEKKKLDPDKATLIGWGFRLVTYHKTELQTATH
jgi:phenylalanine-4-hydroxylase